MIKHPISDINLIWLSHGFLPCKHCGNRIKLEAHTEKTDDSHPDKTIFVSLIHSNNEGTCGWKSIRSNQEHNEADYSRIKLMAESLKQWWNEEKTKVGA